jgi:mannose-6-phosphate isomerase-like protein (cupin superfamily)
MPIGCAPLYKSRSSAVGKKEQGMKMTSNWKIAPAILLTIGMVAASGQFALAQTTASATVDHYSKGDLEGMEKTLEQKTDATGLATETLKKYSSDYTMLAFRSQSGKAELHEKFADFYFVVAGDATLVSGGHIANPATTAPGEVRGDSVQDGTSTKLEAGDLVHIPANLPHQILVAKGTSFRYFIIKVPE